MPSELKIIKNDSDSEERLKLGRTLMPPKDPYKDAERQQSAFEEASACVARSVIDFPKPSLDQQQFLGQIQSTLGAFNPDVIVCGKKHD